MSIRTDSPPRADAYIAAETYGTAREAIAYGLDWRRSEPVRRGRGLEYIDCPADYLTKSGLRIRILPAWNAAFHVPRLFDTLVYWPMLFNFLSAHDDVKTLRKLLRAAEAEQRIEIRDVHLLSELPQ